MKKNNWESKNFASTLPLPAVSKLEPTNGIFDEAEFLAMAQMWLNQGWINTEDNNLIQSTLANNEAKKLLELWSIVFPVSMTVNYFRDSATATVAVVSQNIWQSIKTYFGAFLGLSALQAGFATYYLQGMKSQKIVPWMYFIPILGAFAPLGYLTKEHGRFLQLLWAYFHGKNLFRQQHQVAPEKTLQHHLYQTQIRTSFTTALGRINPVLKVTDRIWKNIQKVIQKIPSQKKLLQHNLDILHALFLTHMFF